MPLNDILRKPDGGIKMVLNKMTFYGKMASNSKINPYSKMVFNGIFIFVVTLIPNICLAEPGIYTANSQTRSFSQDGRTAVVTPTRVGSQTECILKCRVKLKEAFYVADVKDGCYCLHSNNDDRALLSTTTSGVVQGVYFEEHQVNFFILFYFS